MPGTNSRAVAELTLLLMLACLRRLSTIETDFRSGQWALEPDILGAQGELGGRTVGLVGMGAVPTLLAPMLTAMGAKPCYWSRSARAGLSLPFLPLAELLASADIVSLHLPLTNETVGIVDVWSMKKGSILINTARGGLVDEAQLVAALSSKHLAAAGLDVFEAEPISADHPLLALDSVTATPHVAWLTAETLLRSLDFAVLNLTELGGGPCQSYVGSSNKPIRETPKMRTQLLSLVLARPDIRCSAGCRSGDRADTGTRRRCRHRSCLRLTATS